MTDVFQCLKLATIKEVFPDELAYIQQHHFDFAEKHSDFLLLLNDDKLSLRHLVQIRGWMEEERKSEEQKTK